MTLERQVVVMAQEVKGQDLRAEYPHSELESDILRVGHTAALCEGTICIGPNTGEGGCVAKGGWIDEEDSPLPSICMYRESFRPLSIRTSMEPKDEDVVDGSEKICKINLLNPSLTQ